MNVHDAYNSWAEQYDTNNNKTRDLEAIALRTTLNDIPFHNCLEIGCGTGKNTQWLALKAKELVAIDFSAEMLMKAKEKITASHVEFIQADITEHWNFSNKQFDLITFSLVLEHIEHLPAIFAKAADTIAPNGWLYIGELHPFKQYSGSKARFATAQGEHIVTCYNHHISDFTNAAKENNFDIIEIHEYFDDDDKSTIPRILTMLFQKK